MMEGMLHAPAVTNVVGRWREVFKSFVYPLAKSPRACDRHCIIHLSIPPISDGITNVYMSLVTGHVFPADNTRLINIS